MYRLILVDIVDGYPGGKPVNQSFLAESPFPPDFYGQGYVLPAIAL
jgi:hypothetical protein